MAFETIVGVVEAYVAEVTRGTTPTTPTLKTFRRTSSDIDLEKDIVESQEIRATRGESECRHSFNRVAGSLGFEWSLQAYDDFIEYALGGTWATVAHAAVNIQAVASTKKFIRASGSWIVDGYRPGMLVNGAGFTAGANNVALARIKTLTATDMEVDATLVDEASTSGRTISVPGKCIEVAKTLKTVTLERQFQTLAKYQARRGVMVAKWNQTINLQTMVGGTFELLGMSADPIGSASVSGSAPTDAPASSPFAAFDGALFEAGSAIGIMSSLNWTQDNQASLSGVIGSKFSPGIFESIAKFTGSLTALFESGTLLNEFINEAAPALWLKLNDPNATDYVNIMFHRLKYTGGKVNVPQQGPVDVALPFKFLENPTYKTAITIQRSNAV
jgi:hypothetical protein